MINPGRVKVRNFINDARSRIIFRTLHEMMIKEASDNCKDNFTTCSLTNSVIVKAHF